MFNSFKSSILTCCPSGTVCLEWWCNYPRFDTNAGKSQYHPEIPGEHRFITWDLLTLYWEIDGSIEDMESCQTSVNHQRILRFFIIRIWKLLGYNCQDYTNTCIFQAPGGLTARCLWHPCAGQSMHINSKGHRRKHGFTCLTCPNWQYKGFIRFP